MSLQIGNIHFSTKKGKKFATVGNEKHAHFITVGSNIILSKLLKRKWASFYIAMESSALPEELSGIRQIF
jgi:hypothetical protein